MYGAIIVVLFSSILCSRHHLSYEHRLCNFYSTHHSKQWSYCCNRKTSPMTNSAPVLQHLDQLIKKTFLQRSKSLSNVWNHSWDMLSIWDDNIPSTDITRARSAQSAFEVFSDDDSSVFVSFSLVLIISKEPRIPRTNKSPLPKVLWRSMVPI